MEPLKIEFSKWETGSNIKDKEVHKYMMKYLFHRNIEHIDDKLQHDTICFVCNLLILKSS